MSRKRHSNDDDFRCPHCGARLRARAKFCRECGASKESGWGEEDWREEDAGYSEDDDFDYDDYLRREFPEHAPRRSRREQAKRLFVAIVVILLCFALLAWAF